MLKVLHAIPIVFRLNFVILRITVLLICVVVTPHLWAEEVRVGCGTNFSIVAEELKRLFEKRTPHQMYLISNSSGKLSHMARENAQLDILLLGELKLAKQLEDDGFVSKNARFTYAIGKLVLWSKHPDLIDHKGEVLRRGEFSHIAIPDTQDSAYGVAAKKALENLELWSSLAPKIVSTHNVLAVRDLVSAKQIDLGFTALSLLNPHQKIEGSVWILPQRLYPPLEQQVVLLKTAENNVAAQAFMAFLKTPVAYNTIEKYSYSLPKQ
jgi:molybdate transport system substrate-binding protein